MITANDLKTKGIACLEESLADKTEDIITVRGKECFVVMKIEQYHYLREMELEAALYEARQDLASGQFSKDTVDQHVDDLFSKWAMRSSLPTVIKNAPNAFHKNTRN